jgi:hypothetical protein
MGGCEVTHCFLYKLQSKRELHFKPKNNCLFPYPTCIVEFINILVNHYQNKFRTTVFKKHSKLLINRKIKTQQ